MSLGNAWDETTAGSASKLNKVTIISGTGTYIVSLDKDNHVLFRADDSTGGLTADHLYMCSADGLSLIDVTEVDDHDHSGTGQGGNFFNTLNGNKDVFDSGMSLVMRPQKANWVEVVDGTASVADDVDGVSTEHSIKLLTGATSASTANIRMPSLEMDFSERSYFKCLQRLSSIASVAFRVGYGIDGLQVADDDSRNYGIEGCTTVDGNYYVRTATGSARSASDTGTAFDTNRTNLRAEHYPDLGTPKVDAYINQGTVFTKTSNIPTTYADNEPNPQDIFKWSLKNNTAADKHLFAYGVRLVYETSDKWDEQ